MESYGLQGIFGSDEAALGARTSRPQSGPKATRAASGRSSARPKVWLFFVPLTKGDHRGSQAFSTPPAAKYAAKLSQSFDSLAKGDKCRNSRNARGAHVPPRWSGRVGPPSPCARFLPEEANFQFLHSFSCRVAAPRPMKIIARRP